MATKSIGISESTAVDLARVADKHKVSRDKVISKMLDFFRIYGIDPFNYDAPADEMQKIIKRMDSIVAFIKKQEKDILIPTLTRLATKEDTVLNSEQTRLNMNKLLDLLKQDFLKLQKENQQLKLQLQSARKYDNKEHDKIITQVSKMLQEVVGGMRGTAYSGRDDVQEQLKGYER